MEAGETKAHESHVWTTARQLAFQNSSNPLKGPRGDTTAEVETDQILLYISEGFFLWFCFVGFVWYFPNSLLREMPPSHSTTKAGLPAS